MFHAKQKNPRKQNFKQKGPREAQQKNIKFPAAKVPPYITCKKTVLNSLYSILLYSDFHYWINWKQTGDMFSYSMK